MKPYRPSNGSEGSGFIAHFCENCRRPEEVAYRKYLAEDGPYPPPNAHGGIGCPILAASFALGIDEEGYPPEWVEEDDGSNPRCTAFTDTDPPPFVDPNQLSIPGTLP